MSLLECRGCSTPEGVSVATEIVTSDSLGFLGILNGVYDLVIIDVYAMTECISLFLTLYLVN